MSQLPAGREVLLEAQGGEVGVLVPMMVRPPELLSLGQSDEEEAGDGGEADGTQPLRRALRVTGLDRAVRRQPFLF